MVTRFVMGLGVDYLRHAQVGGEHVLKWDGELTYSISVFSSDPNCPQPPPITILIGSGGGGLHSPRYSGL